MSEVTVKELAKVVGTPVDKLILQFKEAGIEITSPDETVGDKDKQALLNHLRRSNTGDEANNSAPSKITLKRKSTSQLKVASGKSRGSVVNVEVRKKRTYVKRSTVLAEQEKLAREKLEQAKAQEAEQEALTQVPEAPVEQPADEATQQPEQAQETIVAEDAVVTDAESDEAKSVTGAKEEKAASKKAQAEAKPEPAAEEKTPEELEKERLEALEKAKEEAKRIEEQEQEALQAKRKSSEEKHRKKDQAKAMREVAREQEEEIYEVLHEPAPVEKTVKKAAPTHRGKPKSIRVSTKHLSELTKHGFEKPVGPIIKEVTIGETITVSELAQKMSVKGGEVIKALMKSGVMATINQAIDQDTAAIIVEEFGHRVKLQTEDDVEEAMIHEARGDIAGAESRAPVVTIMGHVDHGKTSLLDYIRRSKVTEKEAGGITQHIGAYRVKDANGIDITFLDTPGHAAFTAMRARGSKCTDIVVLIVAADDGVMPQTEEAIQHARAAEVPLIVAVNKIDKPEADPDRVKNELVAKEVIPEDWGGDTQFVSVSAISGEGIDELLEAISLQAELAELKAPPTGPAEGVVIESRLDKGRGPVATILVQNGCLKRGDALLVGSVYGRVRALLDENGKTVDEAGPSTPVAVLGLSSVPNAGDSAVVVSDERKAREIAAMREHKDKNAMQQKASSAEDVFAQLSDQEAKSLTVVLKADVHGSVEALSEALEKLSTDEVSVKVAFKGVGGITESDVHLANASNAIIVGFNVRADAAAKRVADEESLQILYYSIIYDVIDEVKKSVRGLTAPKVKEEILGTAEVRDVFRSSKYGAVAGCMVVDGTVKRNNPIRVLRDNVVIFEGELESLRRFKEDVNEVRNAMECGIGVKDYNDVRVGDQIENFRRFEVIE